MKRRQEGEHVLPAKEARAAEKAERDAQAVETVPMSPSESIKNIDYGKPYGLGGHPPLAQYNSPQSKPDYGRVRREAEATNHVLAKDSEGHMVQETALKYTKTDPPLTNEEREEILDYSKNGYKTINPLLRQGEESGKLAIESTRAAESIKAIDSAIAKTETPAMTLYRKCDINAEFGDIGKSDLGDMFSLKGYTSTSVSGKAASEFVGSAVKPESSTIEILYPGGKGGGTFTTGSTQYEKEFEFLLKRGSNMRLVSRPSEINNRYVFEVVP
ncbi:MAG: ADP-ribosyltransferase [Candidatus Methanoplasma sp.]|jgi:hypothetical protein|nr:ADP-ribosyltransferase [Candidatus Methanoplasma sp.]